jgi:hypothetical protein
LVENYGFGYFEETDYSKRAHEAGFEIALAKAAYVYHEEGASFRHVPGRDALFRRNEELFTKRWGRRLRIGYFVNKTEEAGPVSDIAALVARNGHQVIIFSKKGLELAGLPDHFDVRRISVSPVFFSLSAVFKILERKRKKHLDIILTDNRILAALLNIMKPVIDADIIENPDTEKVRERICRLKTCR